MAARVKELLLWLLHFLDSGCFLDSQTLLLHQMLLVLSDIPCEPVHCAEGELIISCIHKVQETVNFLNVIKSH